MLPVKGRSLPRWRKILLRRAMLVAWFCCGAVSAQAREYPPIFGTRETRMDTPQIFAQWTSVLARQSEQERHGDLPCTTPVVAASSTSACLIAAWKQFLAGERGRSARVQLDDVNAKMNAHPYRINPYRWETSREFEVLSGDCKDYAVAKYFALRKLGWADDDLRIVILRDLNLGADHAVLVAYLDNQAYVLDNLLPVVVPASIIHHYRPSYSLNESHWWLHRPE